MSTWHRRPRIEAAYARCLILSFDYGIDERYQYIEGALIGTALGYYYVGIGLGRLNELVMSRPDHVHVLLHHRVHCSAPLLDIPDKPANKPNIIGRIDENLKIDELSYSLVGKHHDALEEYDLFRCQLHYFFGSSVMHKVIGGQIDAFAPLEGAQLLDDELVVKGIGMVEIKAVILALEMNSADL